MAIRKKWKVMKVMLRPSHQASLLLANVATTWGAGAAAAT
jgi:hypothetical protein